MSQEQMNKGVDSSGSVEIVARAGRYYRNTRYFIVVLFVGFGIWCIRDGYVVWPEANARAQKAGQKIPHTDLDIRINQMLGIGLPIFSLLVLARTLYNSRGEYRLSGETLSIPGHPPIPLSAIRDVDNRLWERKGIAYVDYEIGGTSGRFRLDDFVYERKATDEIYDRIVARVGAAGRQS